MGKYIDADLLRKEIEKHIKEVKDAEKRFTPDMGFFEAKLFGIYDVMAIIDSLQQEQQEPSKGNFVFPNFLYARTVDNKTIDVSYAPQSMDAVEYVKNDPIEQPEVDLEEEITIYLRAFSSSFENGIEYAKNIARHFYQLGLKSRKEESK